MHLSYNVCVIKGALAGCKLLDAAAVKRDRMMGCEKRLASNMVACSYHRIWTYGKLVCYVGAVK
jgi:hypothetical protein